MAHRHNRLVGALSSVGAFLVLGASAPAAQAEFDDLFQPIIDAFTMVDPGIAADTDPGSALASLDSLLDGWYQDLVYTPIHDVAPWLFGSDLPGSAVAYDSDSTNIPDTFAVPMQVNAFTQPVVSVSVGGGASVDVLVDTGAAGLVMPIWDINLFGITGLPTGFNIGQFGGSMNYFYVELPTTVTFTEADGDTVTADTSVDAVLFAFPANFSLFGPWSIGDYLGPSNVVGVLGVGPNALGPTPDHIPTADLPGNLGNGVLIDQPNKQLVFGDNPYEGGTVIAGAPWADLKVQLNDGPLTNVRGVIDSGGVFGTMPSSALGDVTPTANGTLPDGTTVQVYTSNGQLLYEYTVDSSANPSDVTTHSPTVTSGTSMNTGNWLFGQEPVYVSYGVPDGQTIVGGTLIQPGT
jgi:hypothetical protein